MKLVDKLLIFCLFVFSRIWLSLISSNPVGVDAWDYMQWIELTVDSGALSHPPLHVPGFYAFVSVIAAFTGISTILLYTTFLPMLGSIGLWYTMKSIQSKTYLGLLLAGLYGFFVIRTSMIIPEWLGLIVFPSAILALSLQFQRKSTKEKYTYGLIFFILAFVIIMAHHLSGGIILLVSISYTIISKNRHLLGITLLLSIITLLIWSTADAFPLKLVGVLLKTSFPYNIGVIPLLIVFYRLRLPSFSPSALLLFKRLIFLFLFVLSLAVAITTGLNLKTIIYWGPSLVILPLSLIGIREIHSNNKLDMNIHSTWIISILLLIVSFSFFPIIRPLIARLLVFEIQALIPVMAVGLSIIIEESYKDHKKKLTLVLVASLLMFNVTYNYPRASAWYQTEFRYYDEELEMAALTGRWLPENVFLDTDNRFGVMYKGICNRETTYGEYNSSWLANNLAVGTSFQHLPATTAVLVSFVMVEIGFLTGKFIHGEGGGAEDVSIQFNSDIFAFLSSRYSKPLVVGKSSLWVNN
ncbi:MAG: hypothetical protein ACXAD7_07795 [Candidatus Kariarchaeaceae archaeon]|jgi:hypothetical protein